MEDLPKDVVDIIMNKLKSKELQAVSLVNHKFNQRYTNLFFAKRCLERQTLYTGVLTPSKGFFVYYEDEIPKETKALDELKLRPCLKMSIGS